MKKSTKTLAYAMSSAIALACLTLCMGTFPNVPINAALATDYPDGDIVTNPWGGTTHRISTTNNLDIPTENTTSDNEPSTGIEISSNPTQTSSSDVTNKPIESSSNPVETTKSTVTEKPTVKNGTKFVVKKYSGRFIIKNSKKRTVQYLNSTNKGRKTAVVPATVKYKGITYKVTSVAGNAFKNHKKLTTVTIGSNVTAINNNAFLNCKKLKKITIKSSKLKTVGKKAFKGIHAKAKIKVPKKKLKAYKKLLKSEALGKNVKITK